MDIQIRLCNVGDAPAIYELNRQEMWYDYPVEKTTEKLSQLLKSKADRIFVAVANGTVVGYIHARDYDVVYAPQYKDILAIAVFSDYKKKGIGRELLSTVERWAKESGAAGIRLVSGSVRTGAHEFYRHCGYNGDKQQINFKKVF